MKRKNRLALLMWISIFLLISLLGMVLIIFQFHGNIFYVQMIFLIALIGLGFLGLLSALHLMRWGSIFLSVSFLIMMSYLFLFFLFRKEASWMFGMTLLSSIGGFLMAVVTIGRKEEVLHRQKTSEDLESLEN